MHILHNLEFLSLNMWFFFCDFCLNAGEKLDSNLSTENFLKTCEETLNNYNSKYCVGFLVEIFVWLNKIQNTVDGSQKKRRMPVTSAIHIGQYIMEEILDLKRKMTSVSNIQIQNNFDVKIIKYILHL